MRIGVPEMLVLGSVLFVSDKDSGMEGPLSKFAPDTRLCCADDAEEKGCHPEGPCLGLRRP